MQTITALLLLAAQPSLADNATAEPEQIRRQIEELRNNPAELQRLRAKAKVFLELPEEQREKITRLDHDLRQQSSTAQARLNKVLDRYTDWLASLDETDRQRIKVAADRNSRLAIVREIRDRDWMKRQPKALRDQYASLEGQARSAFVNKLRADERERRQEWQIGLRFWKELERGTPLPARLTDFPNDVVVYVNEYLRPMLSNEEEDRLDKAQGQWPLYPLTLVELADQHPPALPGPKGPKSFAELPNDVKARFKTKTGDYPPKLRRAEKQWPGFAIAVSSFSSFKKNYVLPHELWPWGKSCLSSQMQGFVDNTLAKAMDSDEKAKLSRAEGKWPGYPVAIQELARKHELFVPWHTLPGTRERWNNYRLK